MLYAFAGVELDTDRRELCRDGELIAVQPQVFDVLVLLVANADRMLSKEELLDTVWGDRFVSESALTTRIKAARQAVGDNGRDQNVIRTVHGHGFSLAVEVTVRSRGGEAAIGRATDTNSTAGSTSLPEPDRPSSTPTPAGATEDTSPDRSSRPPTPARSDVPNHNLPRRRTQLIGRTDIAERATTLLEASDIVSIVGTGGVGKTSLAIDIAHASLAGHPGGVWLCELAQVDAADLGSALVGAIVGGSGTSNSGPLDVADVVPSDPSLLVLDNCEHIVDAVAAFVDELAQLSPGLSILTTSREPLGVRGEHVLRLEGLAHREPTDAAVSLFLERANEASELSDDAVTRDIVVDIVTRLEGLPLAIELAAPRLSSMSPAELLDALDDQLAVLSERRRHVDRQSAMERAIGWSYDLLSPDEQSTLCRFSVFAGAFSIDAAREVTANRAIGDVLHRLVEQSMVSRASRGATTRYRLLEPTRQFVEREIDDVEHREALANHAHYFSQHAGRLRADLWTDDEAVAADTLTAEWADITRAIRWARTHGDIGLAMRPLVTLGPHLLYQQRHEAMEWVHEMLDEHESSVPDELLPNARLISSLQAFSAGDQPLARTRLGHAVQAHGPSAFSGLIACFVEIIGSDFDQLARAGDEFWELANLDGDDRWIGTAAAFRLIGRALADPQDEKIDELISVVAAHQGNAVTTFVTCWGLLSLLTLEVRRGNGQRAGELHAELRRSTAECRAGYFAQIGGGLIAQSQADSSDGVEYLTRVVDSVRATVRTQEATHYGLVFRTAVVALEEAGEAAAAAQILGLLETVRDLGAIRRTLTGGYDDAVARLVATLGDTEFDRLVAAGRQLTPRDGVIVCETVLDAAVRRANEAASRA